MANVSAQVIIAFLKEVFAREGSPEVLVTDNGVQLTSQEMERFLLMCNIRRDYISI